MVLASGSESKVSDSLHAKLVPDGDEIVRLIKLHLVGDEAGAVFFVGSVLEVPASLLLLDETTEGLLIGSGNTILNCAPNLQVLGGIAVVVLGRTLPRDEEAALGREAKLVDVEDRQCEDGSAGGGINDVDSLGGSPAKIAATWRVSTAAEVALRLGEAREGLVCWGGVKDTNVLEGPVGELQWRRHG